MPYRQNGGIYAEGVKPEESIDIDSSGNRRCFLPQASRV